MTKIKVKFTSIKTIVTSYNQIQMQLGLTTQTWCDFILYTIKGIMINRVKYNEEHWKNLRKTLIEFYFSYMLDEIMDKETK